MGGPEGPQWYSLPQEIEKARKAGYFFNIIFVIYQVKAKPYFAEQDKWNIRIAKKQIPMTTEEKTYNLKFNPNFNEQNNKRLLKFVIEEFFFLPISK